MKKKLTAGKIIKRIFLTLIIIGTLGGAFYFGYYQFQLPMDNYAVIFTKINKWNPKVVKPGNFRFEWEGLIPFNLKMEYFLLKPINKNISVSGSLPSASAYSAHLSEKPNFSYEFSLNINYILKPENLPKLCENSFLRPDSYQTMLKDIETKIINESSTFLIKSIENVSKLEEEKYNYQYLTKELKKHLSQKFSYITFIDLIPTKITFPDIELYKTAKNQYFEMEKYLKNIQMKALKETEAKMIKEQTNLDILKKYGEIFKEYPDLINYLALIKDKKETIMPNLSLPIE